MTPFFLQNGVFTTPFLPGVIASRSDLFGNDFITLSGNYMLKVEEFE